MKSAPGGELLRAPLFHTPRNPFREASALESYADGGLLIRDGRVAACGDYASLRDAYPDVPTVDLRGGYLLPGFVDAHTHFPQLRVLGGLGRSLLDWLEHCALPEEARMADHSHACRVARGFVHALASHGTTTALVFGAHFAPATAALFEAAEAKGLRIAAGQVLSDRLLDPELHQTPERAYRESSLLIERFHRHGRMTYAVTPRFALSASEAMLEVCQTLLGEHEGLLFQTHINENVQEIAEVARLFPWASDYLAVYERFRLNRSNAVMAHNVHPSDSELDRLGASGAAVAHCPTSNAALGSGLFPLQRHIHAGVRCALGTDVGGGTGFGMLKEGSASIFAAAHRTGGNASGRRPFALPRHAGRSRGARARRRDRRFSRGKIRRLRVSSPARRQPSRRGSRTRAKPGASTCGDLHAGRRRERARSARRGIRRLSLCQRGGAMTIGELNRMDRAAFIAAVGWIFEHSPWVAERAFDARPFAGLDALHTSMTDQVERASFAERLALLQAHPDLGARARLSEASTSEQAGAGLDSLTPGEFEQLHRLNNAYRARFGFPFLLAVKGSTKHDILRALQSRMEATPEDEYREALRQVYRIARFRLEDSITS